MPSPELRLLTGTYNGLASKINAMRRFYQESLARHPQVRTVAESAAGRGSRLTQARRLFEFVRQHVNYTADSVGFEVTKAPWVMIDEISSRDFSAGDCDDQASLNYTLLKTLGIPARFRVGWYGKAHPQHIYVMALINGEWYPFDTCFSTFGVEQPYTKVYDAP